MGSGVAKSGGENGREFRLERRSNRAGRFILFVVNSVEAKIFSLYFPEGRSLATGWSVLAEKLRHLGVGSLSMASSSPLSVTLGLWMTRVARRRGQKVRRLRLSRRLMVGWVMQSGFRWGMKRFKKERIS